MSSFLSAWADKIREEINILTVAERMMHVYRGGGSVKSDPSKRYYFALCPFHTERTASFVLTPRIGMFHCFGCGAHGSIITLARIYLQGIKENKNSRKKPKWHSVNIGKRISAKELSDISLEFGVVPPDRISKSKKRRIRRQRNKKTEKDYEYY